MEGDDESSGANSRCEDCRDGSPASRRVRPESSWQALGAFPIRTLAEVSAATMRAITAVGEPRDDVERIGDPRFGSVRLDLRTGQSYWRPALRADELVFAAVPEPPVPLTPEERALLAAVPTVAAPEVRRSGCPLAPNVGPQPFLLDPDRRARFTGDRSRYPWRAFTRIRSGSMQQSGAFVGPRHVLTCAHALWNCVPGHGCFLWAGDRGIAVYFGRPGYWRRATDLLIPYEWYCKGSAAGVNFDYALLVLAEDGSYAPGYFTVAAGSRREVALTMSYGFPVRHLFCRDAPAPSRECRPWGRCGDELYGMAMRAQVRRHAYFEGAYNSLGGQSGQVFYRDFGGHRRVLGVLHGTRETRDGKYGQRAVVKRFGRASAGQIGYWVRHCPRGCG